MGVLTRDDAAEHAGKACFDVVALNPPYVYGPWLHEVAAPEQFNTSMLAFWDAVIKGNKTMEELATEGYVKPLRCCRGLVLTRMCTGSPGSMSATSLSLICWR